MPSIVPPVPLDNEWGDDVVTQWAQVLTGQGNAPVFYSNAADPGTAGVKSGTYGIWLNTTSGVIKLWANVGGVMKSVTLT